MGTWNYRIVDRTLENAGDPLFQICEVYYNDKGEPTGFTDACVMAEDVDGIRGEPSRMLAALDKPVVTFSN